MGTILDNREKAMEDKYTHDLSADFKLVSRRNRLFGLWIAGQMGLVDHEAEAYARNLVNFTLKSPGDEALIEKSRYDLEKKGAKVFTAHQLQKKLVHCFEDAKEQVRSGHIESI